MIRFSQQASDQWIEVNLCATPPVIQLPQLVTGQALSLLASLTVYYMCLFTFEKQTFYITRKGLMRHVELHPDRGNSLALCAA